jgi:hypothetical protein
LFGKNEGASVDYILFDKQCSIDALLDKTIAYMLFLQSVSEKAEKVSFFLDLTITVKKAVFDRRVRKSM